MDTITMDLAEDFRDDDGTLYRAGKLRQLPAQVAERIRGAAVEADRAAGEPKGALPDGFPGQRALAAAGVATYEGARALTRAELIELDGVGERTADAIAAALAGPRE
jgi:hypothetical protein